MVNKKMLNNIINSILPVLIALIIGGVVILVIGENPIQTYTVMFGKSIFSINGLTNTLHTASPIILTGLAIAISFKSNLYNMGVEGQFLLGGFVAGLVGAYIDISNPIIHKILCILLGGLAGALFALLPALLRAYFKVDEMVVTLTLNYALIILLEYLSSGPFRDSGAGYVATPVINQTSMFSRIGGTRLTMFFFISISIFALFYYLIKRTKFGYVIEVIGKNPDFAEASGLRVRRKIIMIMLISGLLSGIAGSSHMMSQEFKYTLNFSGTTGVGWDGMLVSLLGGHTPIGVLISSIFYSSLKTGADNISLYTQIPRDIVSIIQALMIILLSIKILDSKFNWYKKNKNIKENIK